MLAIGIIAGVTLLLIGVMEVVDAIAGSPESRALLLGLAIIDIILGILILSLPGLSVVTLASLFAISLIARGVFAIVLAFRLRSVGRHSEPRAAAHV